VQGHEFKSIKEAAKHFGRSYTHIFARLKEGCTMCFPRFGGHYLKGEYDVQDANQTSG